MDESLLEFVAHARDRGVDLPTIRAMLRAGGWKDAQIAEAISAQALELPVPVPPGASSARDTFFQVLAFTALYTSVISLIVLLFTYVNLAFPDAARDSRYVTEWAHGTIRASLAALVVAFPIFLIVWRALLREQARHPDKRGSRVRKGLTYLSLFVGAVTIVSDVITLVYYLFEGELTTRFLLKVAILFVVTGAVFVYLALTLRAEGEAAA
ncbi:MAG: DUF5671 domain-containing protein [Planctomycetota bacterium]|nr:DUF5671 domain-containing protein [Planctomycetota bacterium]